MKTLFYVFVMLLFIATQNIVYSQTFPTPSTGGTRIFTQNPEYIECDQKNSNVPCVKKGEYVVKFLQSITPNVKDSIRKKYRVISFRTCSCGDSYIEFWKIKDVRRIEVLDSLSNLPDDDKDEEALVDGSFTSEHQFYYGKDLSDSNSSVKLTKNKFKKTMLFSKNKSTINIAIIDTGLDFGHFNYPLLYNSAKEDCDSGNSGWNFVGRNSDVRDDNGHGTIIAEIITSNLAKYMYPSKNKKINYSILPIKAFDKDGKGSYFDLLCAMNYVKKFKDIHIVNASFGYKKIVRTKFLDEITKELENRVLIITSAGNEGKNIDKSGNEYFPAGFKSNNILTVGGYKPFSLSSISLSRHSRSNFGLTSVDVAAPFSFKIRNSISQKEQEGTSFSAAYITARTAWVLSKVTDSYKLKERRLDNTFDPKLFYNNDIFLISILRRKILKDAKSSNRLKRFIKRGRYYD